MSSIECFFGALGRDAESKTKTGTTAALAYGVCR
jgi:hypothetical protein